METKISITILIFCILLLVAVLTWDSLHAETPSDLAPGFAMALLNDNPAPKSPIYRSAVYGVPTEATSSGITVAARPMKSQTPGGEVISSSSSALMAAPELTVGVPEATDPVDYDPKRFEKPIEWDAV
jgi:hypothetical protein